MEVKLLELVCSNKIYMIFCESCSVVSDSLQSHGLYCPWNSPGHNTGVGSLSLLQGIFPTQVSNLGLAHCRWILYQLSHIFMVIYYKNVYWGSTICLGFPGGLEVKASACNAGDPGSIPESGRSPGDGNGNPLQYSCLENPMEGGAW